MNSIETGARGAGGRTPSAKALRGLDALNFFLADVRDGLGPYLAIYLIAVRGPDQGWNEATTGLVMTIAGILGLVAQTPAGALIVKGRRLTAVTDKQIRELGVEKTPLHPETALRQAGALFEGRRHPWRDFFANHYVADGDLITGQNQNAGPMTARLMMQRVLDKQRAERRAS